VIIRKAHPAYKQVCPSRNSARKFPQLLIPQGFAHGFVTLTDDVEVQYKVDTYYAPECDRGIRYDDPSIGVDWGDVVPVLSAKDEQAPLLQDSDCNFIFRPDPKP
jgi:dTDP-4-dehydrorhamnose 3,5-epimerase-like enzyme